MGRAVHYEYTQNVRWTKCLWQHLPYSVVCGRFQHRYGCQHPHYVTRPIVDVAVGAAAAAAAADDDSNFGDHVVYCDDDDDDDDLLADHAVCDAVVVADVHIRLHYHYQIF